MIIMSKYNPLWKWINKNKTDDFKLTFAEIENIAGVPIDHSFLTFKKELLQYPTTHHLQHQLTILFHGFFQS